MQYKNELYSAIGPVTLNKNVITRELLVDTTIKLPFTTNYESIKYAEEHIDETYSNYVRVY